MIWSEKRYEINGIATIVDNDGILWLNEKHIEEELDQKNLQEITIKYYSDHRKHRYELENEPKKNGMEFCRQKINEVEEEIRKFWNCSEIHYINTYDIIGKKVWKKWYRNSSR